MMFLPEDDSAELSYMKQQFGVVNSKLDQVLSGQDELKAAPSFCSNHFSTFKHVYFYFTIYLLNKISQKNMISDIPIPQPRKKKAENNIDSQSEVVLRA